MVRWTQICPPLLTALFIAAPAAHAGEAANDPARPWFAQVEVHGSLLNDTADSSLIGVTFGPAVKVGRRWGRWGVFLSLEQNSWLGTDFGSALQPGSINIGVGGEVSYAGGFIRTSLAAGPSVLLWETALDQPGSTGIFVDVRPVGLRWAVKDWLVLMFDPMSFALVAPVLGSPSLVLVQYRTSFTTEFRW
jgi:hypothetical protein